MVAVEHEYDIRCTGQSPTGETFTPPGRPWQAASRPGSASGSAR